MNFISKRFLGVHALNKVSFSVGRGEVHSLMGENGAGKSTLMKILSGVYSKDEGEIIFDGESIEPRSPFHAQQYGISMIYQEINLQPYLSVAENIFIGREPRKMNAIDWKTMYRKADELLRDIGIHVDVQAPLQSQSIAVQQITAIARAVSMKAKLVVMDEPTSSLDEREVKMLFGIIDKLKKNGVSVIFITHKMDEVFQISDKITVLKDGELVGEYDAASLTKLELVSKMIGRDASDLFGARKKVRVFDDNTPDICKVADIHSGVKLNGIDLVIKKGEVVGLAGLLGSGRTELAHVIFGNDSSYKGQVEIKGKKVRFRLPKDAIAMNLAFSSEDRKAEGIFPNMSLLHNMCIANIKKSSRFGVISKKAQKQIGEEFINSLSIKTPDSEQLIKNLSGGNQQKVLLARWLCMNPDLIILDEPTRGIDVGAKGEIVKLIDDIAGKGISVLWISSEIEELIRGCDRIVVLHEGRVSGELSGAEISEENLLRKIAACGTNAEDDGRKRSVQ